MIVGGGPAGMSAAIRLKQLANEVQGVLQFLARSDDRSNIRDKVHISSLACMPLEHFDTFPIFFLYLFQAGNEEFRVCVIEKSATVGGHILSG